MNNTPEISLIMSVYNGEDYLREAIDSVLMQTFSAWEFIIINDCSTDGTAEILSEYAARDERIKVYTNEVNLRLPSSLNKALSYAQGKYIARMDADDICLPDRLEKQYEFMEKNPDTLLIVTSDHDTGGVKLPEGDEKLSSLLTTKEHTATPVRVFAVGKGSEYFADKTVDNTDIAKFLIAAVKGE